MRTCARCNEAKGEAAFGKNRSYCKACHAAYMREYYRRNPDKAEANRVASRRRDAAKRGRRPERHGLSMDQYELMLSRFDGACWSCNERDANSIDHDHACCPGRFSCGNCVRGLLCTQCNTALGLMQDDVRKIYRLIEYLQEDHAHESNAVQAGVEVGQGAD